MFYLNIKKDSELIHSSTRTELGIRVINSVHADKVLVIAPHPDDDAFGCSALLSHLIEHKARAKVLYLCGGVIGNVAAEHHQDLIAQREEEAVEGLRELGGATPIFFRGVDLELNKDNKLWEKIHQEMVLEKPDLMLIPDSHDWHPDHVAAYAAVMLAYHKLKKNKPKVWGYFVAGLNSPTFLFPMDKRLTNLKQNAMSCHKTRLKVKRYDEAILGMNEYLGKGLGLLQPAEGYKEIF